MWEGQRVWFLEFLREASKGSSKIAFKGCKLLDAEASRMDGPMVPLIAPLNWAVPNARIHPLGPAKDGAVVAHPTDE